MKDDAPEPLDALELLGHLITVDCREITVYQAALEHTRDPDDRAQLRRFLADHHRHVAFLSSAAEALGGSAEARPEPRLRLRKLRVILAALLGERGVLDAMARTEDAAKRDYLEAAARPLPARVHLVVEQNLRDELRHAAWLDSRIAAITRRAVSPPA